jgi:amidophosphoribosyltransferase
MIERIEGQEVEEEVLQEYANPESERYARMNEEIRKKLNFTSLRYHRLDDLIKSVGIEPCKLCTYCWDGRED